MGFLDVIIAAAAAFALGAVYYMVLSKPWVEAAGIAVGDDGKPINSGSPTPYLVSFVMIVLVAGMMRHTFALGEIDTMFEAWTTGLGIGLFFITPWIFVNTGYSDRPWKLAVIDGGYATLACLVIGIVLHLLA